MYIYGSCLAFAKAVKMSYMFNKQHFTPPYQRYSSNSVALSRMHLSFSGTASDSAGRNPSYIIDNQN